IAIGIKQPAGAPFKLPAAEPVAAPLRVIGARNPPHFLPPQYGPHAGKQFPRTEWLDDVVVRAEFEADNAIDFVGPMSGRDDDGNVRMRTDLPQHVQPVVLAESQV